MQFSKYLFASALVATASAAFANVTTITKDITITAYTTYCPYPTTVTLTICDEYDVCAPQTIAVAEPTTLTVYEKCVVPTSYTTVDYTVTEVIPCQECAGVPTREVAPPVAEEVAPPVAEEVVPPYANTTSTYAPIAPEEPYSAYEGAGAKSFVGAAAGLAAIIAALM
ncbi:uncharacterized protein J8A68_005429 [[Candida] subhashii]|uniref:Uncharacterized protein n=1 Tax=[Candida] subhashii TaxID=561895 RepID=A0A8J5QGX1_9ASCO|nr:uncharacterized protein J8A68_005429 [[Candida] subhashii]KAG7661057.1 hypothetical protein J8A68_005429 [[Candida] subhashii]